MADDWSSVSWLVQSGRIVRGCSKEGEVQVDKGSVTRKV